MKSDALNIRASAIKCNKTTHKEEQPKSELTLEKLRTYKGFENVSDEKAAEDIKAIKTFARILYDIYQRESRK